MSATVKKGTKVIPTYIPKDAMDLPMFFENKPYQGASGRIYPIPFSDGITDEKKDVQYEVYTLENEYIHTEVLPEFGGKILRGYDKVGSHDFIYYNEVVKPALVGIGGPWISGGIEFNWPQHHRPTTYLPLEAKIEETDGEKTVWTGEVEPFNRMKGMAGIAIQEGRSFIKAKVKVYNRTAQSQLFMWWANLAVPVNEHYKTILPPDVEWINDHDRRCVMSWPIAKGVYHTARPFNYGEGTDISHYSSIKVPSSFLVSQGQSDMDFVAGYDEGIGKGIVTVADHHVSPGKKMWDWGKGDFGEMWCNNLTDENGPYIELMTGVYTDNQPDFTWLAPYESRTFEQYWYPVREIGDVKNATIDAAMNVEQRGDNLFFGFHATGVFPNCKVLVTDKGEALFEETAEMSPEKPYVKEIPMSGHALEDILVSLLDENGNVLVQYQTYVRGQKDPIEPRKPVKRPCEIETVEELFVNGYHLEQYKQHNYDPRAYYLEGLKRDPGDIRCNTGMARISLKNGDFASCVRYAEKAQERLLSRNQHPGDLEALYLKGIALTYLGEYEESYKMLGRAAWDYKYASAANYQMALLDCRKKNWLSALEKLDTSLRGCAGHTKAMNLKAAIYRQMGKADEALDILRQVRSYDPLDFWSLVELSHYGQANQEDLKEFSRKSENYLDVVCDYMEAGLYEDALYALKLASMDYPLFHYYRAACLVKLGQDSDAYAEMELGEQMDTGYCFPNRLEDIAVLKKAIELCDGANAWYYLGCLWYDRFDYENAISCWENTIALNPCHAKALRNLSLAYFDKKGDFLSAKACMEAAMQNKPEDARLLLEYQQLLKNMHYTPAQRLAVYEKHQDLMDKRDDCYLDKITLKCLMGEYQTAIDLAKNRRFHIYEGGEGKLTKQHAWMHVLYAKELMEAGKIQKAEEVLWAGINMPKSYGEAKTFFNQEAHIYYYLGCLLENAGLPCGEVFAKAAEYKAAISEISLFRALALRKQMLFSQAKAVLDEMLAEGNRLIENCDLRTYYGVGSHSPMPFENDVVKNNLTDGYVLKAYALLGIGRFNEADSYIRKAKELNTYDFRVFAFERIKDTVTDL